MDEYRSGLENLLAKVSVSVTTGTNPDVILRKKRVM